RRPRRRRHRLEEERRGAKCLRERAYHGDEPGLPTRGVGRDKSFRPRVELQRAQPWLARCNSVVLSVFGAFSSARERAHFHGFAMFSRRREESLFILRTQARSVSAAIEVDGLVKHYGTLAAVDGIRFSVPSGTVFAFLGPNGAGKTTTTEILEGLRRRTSGEVRVLGLDPW